MVQDSNIFDNSSSNDLHKFNKRKMFQRSSIESFVSPPKEKYANVPSKINLIWKEKNNQKSQRHVKE
jgi:hypothetical protein